MCGAFVAFWIIAASTYLLLQQIAFAASSLNAAESFVLKTELWQYPAVTGKNIGQYCFCTQVTLLIHIHYSFFVSTISLNSWKSGRTGFFLLVLAKPERFPLPNMRPVKLHCSMATKWGLKESERVWGRWLTATLIWGEKQGLEFAILLHNSWNTLASSFWMEKLRFLYKRWIFLSGFVFMARFWSGFVYVPVLNQKAFGKYFLPFVVVTLKILTKWNCHCLVNSNLLAFRNHSRQSHVPIPVLWASRCLF